MQEEQPLQYDSTGTGADEGNAIPKAQWGFIGLLTVFAMASQVSLWRRVPVTPADILLGLSLLVVVWDSWRNGRRWPMPWPVLLFLVLLQAVAAGARSGLPGAVEGVQRIEQFFAAFLLFQWLLRDRPGRLAAAVSAAVALNVGIALAQGASFGFGPRMHGLFRSRMALSFFLAVAGAWCLPFWWTWSRGRAGRSALVVIFMALILACMAHGQMLLVAGIVWVIASLLHSRHGFALTLAAGAVFLASLGLGPAGAPRRTVLASTLSPFREGRIRQCHTELVAAVRMAEAHPWTGVGLGHYQQWIGTFYRELPNPNVNDIETDTQSGYGILLGTSGFPAGVLFILLYLAAGAAGIRAWYAGDRRPAALAGSAGVLAVLAGMGISDPLVRGVGWFAVLALASAWGPKSGPGPRLGWKGLAAWGFLLAVLPVLTAVSGSGRRAQEGGQAAMAPSPAVSRPTRAGDSTASDRTAGGETGREPGTNPKAFPADPDFFKVLNAAATVKRFTPPFDKEKKAGASGEWVLAIPDEKGKPPEGAKPGMQYGGAVFEVDAPQNMTCAVWMRVWWVGSCGNSVFYRHSDGTTIAVGNDGTYNVWHWLRVPGTFRFQKGKNTFYVLDREDGIYLDQIVITGDLQYVPQGVEEE